MRQNVILVVFDAARRDALEPYGAPPGSTPVIADLARRGMKLDEVYATGCWTVPSHAGFFTGKLPRSVGLASVPGARPPGVKGQLEMQRDRLLPEVLRRAGYRTAAASANLWVSEASGFNIGFDDFAEIDSGRQGSLDPNGARAHMRWWSEAVRGRVDDGAGRLKKQLSAWIDSDSEPFFCFVNIVECHSPYLPPRPYAPGSPLERVRVAEDASRHYTLEAIWQTCLGGREVPDDALERLRRQYAGSIRYMDSWLGEMVETLDSRGRLDETIVIVISDHGENFGEGGLIAHSLSLDNRLIHVPFVCSGPTGSANEIHSLAALPGFIAEAVGIQDHPWSADDFPQGVGIAQHDPPLRRDDPRAVETVIENWGLGEDALTKFTASHTCAVRGRFKVLKRERDLAWFDLREDPLELDPRPYGAAGAGEVSELESLRKVLEDPRVTSAKGPARDEPASQSQDEVADLEERMRLLGYL